MTGPHDLHEDDAGQWECYCCGRLESADGAALIRGDAFAGHVRAERARDVAREGERLLARQIREEERN